MTDLTYSPAQGGAAPRQLARSTSVELGENGAAGLWWEEDPFGHEHTELVAVDVAPGVRVFMVSGESRWLLLCREYPLDVTRDKQADWGQVAVREGHWAMPDWGQASRDLDAVHLSAMGGLDTAGRALKVGNRTVIMIAGWNPAEICWLRSCAQLTGRAPPQRAESGTTSGEVAWYPTGPES